LESSSTGASLDEEALKRAVVSLQTNGFINYFGLQRFGSCLHAPTHAIGR
jgi:tRNA(Glu) U13 pseudouridine synthase TruD